MTARRLLTTLAAALLAGTVWAADSTPPPKPGQAGPAKPEIEMGPALGWTFPIYTDKEGYHLLTLRGSVARVISDNQIDVSEFIAYVFTGDATQQVDSVLLSPQASFFPKDNRVSGKSTVRLIHDNANVEVTGRDWVYDHAAKRVSIAHDVRVTFRTKINDILK